MKIWSDESCLACPNLMRNEYYLFAEDDIQLCHACYTNDNLRKYNYEQV